MTQLPTAKATKVSITLYPPHLEMLERHAQALVRQRPYATRSAVIQDILERFAETHPTPPLRDAAPAIVDASPAALERVV